MSRIPLDTVLRGQSGEVQSNALLYVYHRGTETPVTGYTTETGNTPVVYPLHSNIEGRFPEAWYAPGEYDLYVPSDIVSPTQPWSPGPTSEEVASRTAATVVSPGAEVDVGPILQEAFDNFKVVGLMPGETYFLNTPIFLDNESLDVKYVLKCNGAYIKFGASLPSASTQEGLAGTKVAFFNNTKRTALSAGVVTTTEANSGTGAGKLPPLSRFVVEDGIFDANEKIIGIAFGNIAATVFSNCEFRNIQYASSWSGYTDGNGVRNCQMRGANPTGGGTSRMIYQRASGDGTFAIGCKSFGGVTMDLAACKGFVVSNAVGGEYIFQSCKGVVHGSHEEVDETNLPIGFKLDRSRVTFIGNQTFPPKSATKYTFKVADEAGHEYATKLSIIDHDEILYLRSKDEKDAVRGPSIYIESLNENGRVRCQNFHTYIQNGVSGSGDQHPEGCYITSAIGAINTAITAGADQIATGNFELIGGTSWQVRALNGAIPAPRGLTTPTVTASVDATGVVGALSSSSTYQYVAAVKAGSRYTTVSSTTKSVASASGTVALHLTNPSGGSVLALWRQTGESVKSAPDHYIEIPFNGRETEWLDTGTHINGRTWQTAGLPIPNSVGGISPARVVSETVDSFDNLPYVIPNSFNPTGTTPTTAKRAWLTRFTVARKREFNFVRWVVSLGGGGTEEPFDGGIFRYDIPSQEYVLLGSSGEEKFNCSATGVRANHLTSTVTCVPGEIYYVALSSKNVISGGSTLVNIANNNGNVGDIVAEPGTRLMVYKSELFPLASFVGPNGSVGPAYMVPSEV